MSELLGMVIARAAWFVCVLNTVNGDAVMKRSMLIAILGVAVVLMAGGCKSVQTTFVNTTNEPLELTVNGPGLGTGYLGEVPAGGELTTLIQVSPIWLPTTYNLTAGNTQQSFSLANDCNERIMIAIPDGATIPSYVKQSTCGEKLGSPTPVVTTP